MGQDRNSTSSPGSSKADLKRLEKEMKDRKNSSSPRASKSDLKKVQIDEKKEISKAKKDWKRKEKDRQKWDTKPDDELSKAERLRRHMQRVEILARPTSRHLRVLWDEKCDVLPRERRDKIKSALEEDYFLSPEQTEQYFQALNATARRWAGPGGIINRKDTGDKSKELRQRQKWLVNFSAQVAYRLCDYIAKGQKEMLVSNRLRSIADVVLERVAEILGEPKPTRSNPSRLSRFMVAISDRIAVWIENAVYRADAIEDTLDREQSDTHIRLDAEKIYN